jgi:hypothetical protein
MTFHRASAIAAVVVLAGCTIEHRPRVDSAGVRDAATSPTNCGVATDTVVTGTGIGDLRIGRPWSEVGERCLVVDSPENAELTGNGTLTVDLFRDTATVQLANGRISYIELRHSDFRTSDSLGVRTALVDLLRVPDIRGETIGGRLYARSDSLCGLRFEVVSPAPSPPAAQSGLGALTRLPGETRVRRLAIVGC